MKQKIELVLKRIVITLLCISTFSTAIVSAIPVAKADSSQILGTNVALGSPILNNNATIDKWNKWEMVCWGVFLSNFCQPLIDNYRSAFQATGKGSNGIGYQALKFGTGNDATNNETIEALCSQAITYHESIQKKQVFVAYTEVTSGKLGDKPDQDTLESELRQANFEDFLLSNDSSKDSYANFEEFPADQLVKSYGSIQYLVNGKLPTFYVKGDSNKYIEVLDYTDGWDVQMMASIFNNIRDDYKSEFESNFKTYLEGEEKYPVTFDAFGNLIVDDKVMFPAACNQHLTESKSINLMNSLVVNSYVSTYNENQVVEGLTQTDYIWGVISAGGDSGMPAFSVSDIGTVGLLYYDLDSAFLHGAFDSGSVFKNTDFGKNIKTLFNSDIHSTQNKLPLKFEVANSGVDKSWKATVQHKFKPLENTLIAAQSINNMNSTSNQPEMLTYLEYMDGTQVDLFDSDPVLVAVQVVRDADDKLSKNGKALRTFWNFLLQAYRGKYVETRNTALSRTSMDTYLDNSSTIDAFETKIKDAKYWESFQSTYEEEFGEKKMPTSIFDVGDNESFSANCSRLCMVYPVSKVLKSVSSVLSIKDGTEFGVYSPYIYVTYLDWYGIVNQTTLTSGTESISKFNKDLFPEGSEVLKFDPSTVASIKSDESMTEEVLQMSYLMLHPTDGRSYRKKLIYNGISDFLYEQYNRIVYGGSDSVYGGSASKSNSGFLAVETYSNNFLTSWFLNNYVDIAVWMIAVCCILIIIIGLLKSRKFSWFIMCIFTIVNVILLVPSSGEITPYITSSMVQRMFSSKMTYWGISEGIANATMEADITSTSNTMAGLTEEEATQVMTLVKQLSVIYTDRSLMLKQDISQKLTQKLGGVYTEIQSLQSARWILPTLMQQFTADEGREDDYVYVSLSNTWDDGSNLYWYFNPVEASWVTKETATSSKFWSKSNKSKNETGEKGEATTVSDDEGYSNLNSNYNGHKNETWRYGYKAGGNSLNYQNYCYTIKSNDEIVHLYSWVNPNQKLTYSWSDSMGNFEDYEDSDSWQKFIDDSVNATLGASPKEMYETKTDDLSAWEDTVHSHAPEWDTKNGTNAFEDIADQYERNFPSSLRPGYSFYRTTESPYYYFFNVVKDTFPDDVSIGAVIGRLQGKMEVDAEGNEVRTNFMYATTGDEKEEGEGLQGITADGYTGYVRDVGDLEELFTNVIPYLYTMTLYTGGFDGESGILLDTKISDESDYYEGINQSWAYRCNWAAKIMENRQYSKPTYAYDLNDDKKTVNNPLMPASYMNQVGRPMIFSEAQMEAEGLKENDLTLVELKCIKVNKEIAKKWTLLINYAGTEGLTKEVLYREMGIIATNEFCQEFSTGGITDNKYSIYPQALDLRYLSFDSVMKLLMINVSKDTSYVYGDTMSVLIEETDIFTAIILLICAFMCAFIIPLLRCILMAMIFYLGFLAIIRALFSSAAYKGKIACGQLISNLLFMLYTIAYYACFCGLMAISSSDEVLSIDRIKATPGNPVWLLFAVIIFSGAYIFLMWKQICFCFAHYRDMGFEVYSTVASAVTGKLHDTLDNIGNKISNFIEGDTSNSTTSITSNTNSIKGTGIMGSKAQDVNIKQANGSTLTVSTIPEDDDESLNDSTFNLSYNSGTGDELIDNSDSYDIDAQIRAGEQMD